MTIMSDIWIKEQCVNKELPMIEPYFPESIGKTDGIKHPSYGQSSYGYDIRLGRKFKLMTPQNATVSVFDIFHETPIIDTRSGVPEECWEDIEADSIVIPPSGCVLGYSLEHIRTPRDVEIICMAKSSIARVFLQACVTPIESGWSGHVTIEMHNPTPYPIRVHAGDGIMQMLFFKGDQPCEVSYADRNGKYQNQPAEPVPSRML